MALIQLLVTLLIGTCSVNGKYTPLEIKIKLSRIIKVYFSYMYNEYNFFCFSIYYDILYI